MKKSEPRDSEHDKFLAAAVEAQVDYVVSGDKDLLDLKAHKGARIVTPAQFRGGGQTQKHGVADRQSSARRASVNASGRAKERLGGIASSDHGGVVMTGNPEFEPLANAGQVAVEWPPRRRA